MDNKIIIAKYLVEKLHKELEEADFYTFGLELSEAHFPNYSPEDRKKIENHFNFLIDEYSTMLQRVEAQVEEIHKVINEQ